MYVYKKMSTISMYNKNIKVRNIKALTTIWLPFINFLQTV